MPHIRPDDFFRWIKTPLPGKYFIKRVFNPSISQITFVAKRQFYNNNKVKRNIIICYSQSTNYDLSLQKEEVQLFVSKSKYRLFLVVLWNGILHDNKRNLLSHCDCLSAIFIFSLHQDLTMVSHNSRATSIPRFQLDYIPIYTADWLLRSLENGQENSMGAKTSYFSDV